ncbi:MAG: PD40 domain-containing protein, partial [Planctomycetaceae bacterium]|nr:PD40 domain-containing protein [Planctomycetaceae bacterium]
DRNEDGQVSLEEAQEFLHRQIGVHASFGSPLILSDGRTLDLVRFWELDRNEDDRLAGKEWAAFSQIADGLQGDITVLDFEQFPELDIQQYTRKPEFSAFDPAQWFRVADTNLDAHVDHQELNEATRSVRRNMAHWCIAVFDDDKDGRLSLREYLVSMHANRSVRWEIFPNDRDEDGLLSFSEFRFGPFDFPLLRRYYFGRLDENGDQRLSPDEYPFTAVATTLHRLSADGTVYEQYNIDSEFRELCRPWCSRDGKLVVLAESLDEIAGKDLTFRNRPVAVLPENWLLGKRANMVVFDFSSQTTRPYDNKTPHMKLSFSAASSLIWSPSGYRVAGIGANILKVEAGAGFPENTLYPGDLKVSRFGTHLVWSADEKLLALTTNSDQEIAIFIVAANSSGPAPRNVWRGNAVDFGGDLAWSPDGKRIVFPLYSQESRRMTLHELDVTNPGTPVEVVGDKSTADVTGCCFSPDGKWLVYTTWERGSRWN